MSEEPGRADEEIPQPLPQHPLVERLKPDPSQPAQRVTELTGLPGDSDRSGYQRLYLTMKLDYYAEFLVQDIVYTEAVPADESPSGRPARTKVGVRRDATINYTWSQSPQPVDEFDLDVRLGTARPALPATSLLDGCPPPPTIQETCPITHCNTCNTHCDQATCATCNTRCEQATCAATCNTCNTNCDQATCAVTCTCNTNCDQATCNTCFTYCAQQTCACACP
jgi:hypothetical protein